MNFCNNTIICTTFNHLKSKLTNSWFKVWKASMYVGFNTSIRQCQKLYSAETDKDSGLCSVEATTCRCGWWYQYMSTVYVMQTLTVFHDNVNYFYTSLRNHEHLNIIHIEWNRRILVKSMLNWLCNLILGRSINQTALLTTLYSHINMEVLIGLYHAVFTGWKYYTFRVGVSLGL